MSKQSNKSNLKSDISNPIEPVINEVPFPITIEFIKKRMKELYPNLPVHKMALLMRVFREMDKSDWLPGEIIMPSPNSLPKTFWTTSTC